VPARWVERLNRALRDFPKTTLLTYVGLDMFSVSSCAFFLHAIGWSDPNLLVAYAMKKALKVVVVSLPLHLTMAGALAKLVPSLTQIQLPDIGWVRKYAQVCVKYGVPFMVVLRVAGAIETLVLYELIRWGVDLSAFFSWLNIVVPVHEISYFAGGSTLAALFFPTFFFLIPPIARRVSNLLLLR